MLLGFTSSHAIQIWWHTTISLEESRENIWLQQGTNYSVHEHLVLTTDTNIIPQFMPTVTETVHHRVMCAGMQYVALTFVVIVRWPRDLNTLQLQKTNANRKSTSKSRTYLHQFDSRCCKCSQQTHRVVITRSDISPTLYNLHHVWCACRSQEECTDSNVF